MKRYALYAAALILVVSAIAYAAACCTFGGKITDIDQDAKTLVIKNVTVYASDATVVSNCGEAASFSDLTVGQYVRTCGDKVDGKFVASCICIKPACGGKAPKARGGCAPCCAPCK